MINDSDIKIYSPQNNNYAKEDFSFSEKSKIHQSNGNIQKAKQFGAQIAQSFSLNCAKDEINQLVIQHNLTADDNLLNHLTVLDVFCAEYSINNFLFSDILAHTSISSMYGEMLKSSKNIYNNVLQSTDFSFYYATVNKKFASKTEIGRTFAMLCGKKQNIKYISLGEDYFELCVTAYKNIIESVDFAD